MKPRDRAVLAWAIGLIIAASLYLAHPLFPKFSNQAISKMVELAVGATGALAAAFFGARAAFSFDRSHAAQERLRTNVEDCNRALLVLRRQWNWMSEYQRQSLGKAELSPFRHLQIGMNRPFAFDHWRVDVAPLAFLIGTVARELPFELALRDDHFHHAIGVINAHGTLFRDHVYPALEKLGLLEGTPEEQDRALDAKLVLRLRVSSDQVFKRVSDAVFRHALAITKAAGELQSVMPSQPFYSLVNHMR